MIARFVRRIADDVALRRRYRIGRRFSRAVHDFMAPNLGHAMYDIWLDYALGTNLRGAVVVEHLARYRPVSGARSLDVGCAYGGVCIAFAEAGCEAVGIDVEPRLLAFAERNVTDRRADVTLARVDVTDGAGMRALGRFGFVTCSDVIEHVADVPAALAHLAGALEPGGILQLQIPNGRAARLVQSDGHFHVFAITLLERQPALHYFAEGAFAADYDVHCYLRLDEYLEQLARLGVRPAAGPVANDPADAGSAVRAVADRLGAIEDAASRVRVDPRLSPDTRRTVADAATDYVAEVRAALASIDAGTDERARTARELEVARLYAIECWDLVLRKDV
jgi:2-polyprenyl-3-methyl-5-hydroxy-6-metoxy-1,4-benzoquinol methylase